MSKNNSRKLYFIKNKIKQIKSSKLKFNFSEMLTIMIISVLIGLLIGCSIVYENESVTVIKVPEELEEFISTYNNISNEYYKNVDNDDLINSAIKGMIDFLDDPYSEFLENEESVNFNDSVNGEYVGIGVTVSYDGTYARVSSMYNNSPAKKVGMEIGDVLIEIDGTNVEKMGLSEISKLIKGKSGTEITIKVLRNNLEREFNLIRSKIAVPSVTSKTIEKNNQKIGYIIIDIFSSNTYKQFSSELKKLENKKISSLIIDVRNNPGGHLSQVTNILELFNKKGNVLYQIEKKGTTKNIKDQTSERRKYNIAILVNKSSASASELLASSLKETYGAKLIGVTTYGKGTVQSAYQLSNGSTLKYTTQKWLTPKGNWINEKGVIPDYEEQLDENYYENPSEENDNQLQRALDILTNKEEEKTK